MTNDEAALVSGRTRSQIPLFVMAGFLLGIGGIALLRAEHVFTFSAAALWAFALFACGLLFGFLFAIPRGGLENGTPSDATNGETSSGRVNTVREAAPKQSSRVNSNLVEVSDWLTKIIIGVGLVELKRLPGYGESFAKFIAGSLVPSDVAPGSWLVSFAGAIALYFGVLGFVSGYLLTRVFLATVISLADRDAEGAFLLPSGTPVGLDNLLDGFKKQIEDLQVHMLKLLPSTKAVASDLTHQAAPGTSPHLARADVSRESPLPLRVLWVDDKPGRLALHIDRLSESGIVVDVVNTTAQAISKVRSASYGALITDMHRDGERGPRGPAGIVLLSTLKDELMSDQIPYRIVYTGRSSVDKYGDVAKAEGADLVTTSELELLQELERLFPMLRR